MVVKIKLLTKTAKLPTQGSKSAAGFDVYSDEEIYINPGTCEKVHTGFSSEIPEGYFAGLYPRSGISTKQGLRLANCVGVIDSDYRGEWLVPLYNDSDEIQHILAGDRISQFVIHKKEDVELETSDELNTTERGSGGFGSTGVQ